MMLALRNIIIAHLRRIGYRNTHRKDVEAAARKSRGNYECAACKQLFKRQEIHLDHITPVVDPHTGFTTWDDYIARLFEGELQALCLTCHYEKSKQENIIRRSR